MRTSARTQPHGHRVLAASGLTNGVVVTAELPSQGVLDTCWDHRHLNDCVPLSLPVSTGPSSWPTGAMKTIPQVANALETVRVSESGSTWAEYRPDHPRTGWGHGMSRAKEKMPDQRDLSSVRSSARLSKEGACSVNGPRSCGWRAAI